MSTIGKPYMSTIGTRVRDRRKQLGFSQIELAASSGIKQPTLSQIERDQTQEMEASTLAGLCRELMLTPDYLIFGIGEASDADLALKESELLFIIRSINKQKQETLLDMARALYAKPAPVQVPVIAYDAMVDRSHKKH